MLVVNIDEHIAGIEMVGYITIRMIMKFNKFIIDYDSLWWEKVNIYHILLINYFVHLCVNKWKYNPTFLASFAHSIIAGIVLSVIAYLVCTKFEIVGYFPILGASFFGGFAIWGKIIEYKTKQFIKNELKMAHAHYASRCVDSLRGKISGGLRGRTLIYDHKDLENCLLKVCQNCNNEEEIDRFKQHKSIVAGNKTLIEKSEIDSSLTVDYTAFIC